MVSLLVVLASTLAVICLVPALLFPSDTLRILRRKNYQYEVTFGLYMLTPTEKVVLNSIFLIIGSVFFIALTFYFPRHISEVSNRVIYYWSGHFLETASHPISSISGGVASLNHAIQNSFGNVDSRRLLNASQQVMSGAQDLIKGLTAAAAAEVANTLSAAASAVEPAVKTETVSLDSLSEVPTVEPL